MYGEKGALQYCWLIELLKCIRSKKIVRFATANMLNDQSQGLCYSILLQIVVTFGLYGQVPEDGSANTRVAESGVEIGVGVSRS